MNELLTMITSPPPGGEAGGSADLVAWVVRALLTVLIIFAARWSQYSVARMNADAKEIRQRELEYRKDISQTLSLLQSSLRDHKADVRHRLEVISRELADYRRKALRLSPHVTPTDEHPTIRPPGSDDHATAETEDVDLCSSGSIPRTGRGQ